MSLQHTHKINFRSQPLRASLLVLLMLCMLISCPIKRELHSILLKDAPVESNPTAHQQVKKHGPAFQASVAVACVKTVQTLLEEMEIPSFQKLDLKSPLLFLAFTLASFYLLLVGSSGKSPLRHSFSGGSLAGKIPLFLRHRQLII